MPLSHDAQLLILGTVLGAVLTFVLGLIGIWFKHCLDRREYERRRKQEQAERRAEKTAEKKDDELKAAMKRYRPR